jgi:hypothetical protein
MVLVIRSSVLVLILTFIFLFPLDTFAHLPGQPPFFKINNKYSNLYPVPTTSLEDFELPQDLAAENYLVGEELVMEFDTSQLPVTPQTLSQTKFFWDFGDGQKGTGLKNTHTFSNAGSYIVSIDAQYLNDGPQLIQSVMVNILPSAGYEMPQAVIKVNGKKSQDPLIDILKFDFKNSLEFDGSESYSKNSRIVSYVWDFGDRQSGTNPKEIHQFDTSQAQVFPVLKVKDENGLIGDAFVEIQNSFLVPEQNLSKTAKSENESTQNFNNNVLKILAAVISSILVVGVILYVRKRI